MSDWFREMQERRDRVSRERSEKIARSVRYSVILTVWREIPGTAGPETYRGVTWLDPVGTDNDRLAEYMDDKGVDYDAPILFWHCVREAE